MIRINNVEFSDLSERDVILGGRLTHGISTHYGHLPGESLHKRGDNDISAINKDIKLNNILSSTIRDTKVSPFVHLDKKK